jgi:SAM-dependent methyltransferase
MQSTVERDTARRPHDDTTPTFAGPRRPQQGGSKGGVTDAEVPRGGADAVCPREDHDFDSMYAGTPPWDIGRPQAAFLGLAEAGALISPVIDVGCGTGEHVLMASALGLEATGVDISPTAIAKAERKASERGLTARFHVQDALELGSLGEEFVTVLDCGLFHIFSDEDRLRFVESLGAVTPTGACYHMLCFSDRQRGDKGPRRVSRGEIRAAFMPGWRVESIEPARIEVTWSPEGAEAWLAAIRRT